MDTNLYKTKLGNAISEASAFVDELPLLVPASVKDAIFAEIIDLYLARAHEARNCSNCITIAFQMATFAVGSSFDKHSELRMAMLTDRMNDAFKYLNIVHKEPELC